MKELPDVGKHVYEMPELGAWKVISIDYDEGLIELRNDKKNIIYVSFSEMKNNCKWVKSLDKAKHVAIEILKKVKKLKK